MNKFIILASILFATSAFAESKNYTVNDLFNLSNGLNEINKGYTKIVKDGPKETPVPEQFDFTPSVKISFAKNIVRVSSALEPIQKEIQAIRNSLCGKTNCTKQEDIDNLNKEIMKISQKTVSLDLIELSENDLKLDVNKEISPVTLNQLKSILPFLK